MINTNKENFIAIKNLYSEFDIEKSTDKLRSTFSMNDNFSIFTLLSHLDTMVIIYDNKDLDNTRYISFSEKEEKNYLVLSASRSVEQMRFDAACMLKELIKKTSESHGNFCLNLSIANKKFSREDKYFACALLMPRNELVKEITKKDENGKYLYIDKNGEIDFKYVHLIADHFGVPFNQCLSRIFHVLLDLKKDGEQVLFLKGCYDKKKYKELKANYTDDQREKDLLEMIPDYNKHNDLMITHLIDSLHYRSYSRLSEIAKRKLLVNLVKFDSVNEGVIKNEEEAKAIINNYISSGGKIEGGHLVSEEGVLELSDEQLVVLGEYELYNKTLERGFIRGIAAANPHLESITKMDYKDAINSINERDITYYIKDLHRRLFSKLSNKYDEVRGGNYRLGPVKLAGTCVETADPYMIPQLMDNLSYRILQTLKKNANGELTNSEYLKEINESIYTLIRMQPFSDGNKRTARLLSNILYQEKGIPYILLPTSDWDKYIEAWSSDKLDKYNRFMNELILDSYKYFYGDQSVGDITHSRVSGKKIIMGNHI